jgi:hypothetical protein
MADPGVLPARETPQRSPRSIGEKSNQRKPGGETANYCFKCGLPQPCSCAYKATGEAPRTSVESTVSNPKPFK